MKKTVIAIILMSMILVSCQKTKDTSTQTDNIPKEGEVQFGALINTGQTSYNLSIEDSYLLEFEILNAQDIYIDSDKAEYIEKNMAFSFQLFPRDKQMGNEGKSYAVCVEEERYYVMNREKIPNVVYVLHPYYSPIIKEILEKK